MEGTQRALAVQPGHENKPRTRNQLWRQCDLFQNDDFYWYGAEQYGLWFVY